MNNVPNQKRFCFIVPTFPPHFDFARNLFSSYQRWLINQADFYFILTYENEVEPLGLLEASCIILPEALRVFDKQGIVNIKKFFALTVLQDDYDYIICLDSESLLIKEVDLLTVCETYFSEKQLLGNKARNDVTPILNQCLTHFPETLDCSALNLPLYLWFNNLCIYKSALLPDFFQKTGIIDKLTQLTFFDFDYCIFMNYLVFYQNFTVVDLEIEADWAACEASQETELAVQSKKHQASRIYLCSPSTQSLFENPQLFVLVHLDRMALAQASV